MSADRGPDRPSESDPPDQADQADQTAETDQPAEMAETPWQRQRRLAAVFGDVLPETTADEREHDQPRTGSDEWLKSQVPPHHG